MHRIKNLTNSPYPIAGAGGTKVLPARGEITVEVAPGMLSHYRALGYFEIDKAEAPVPVETTTIESTEPEDQPANAAAVSEREQLQSRLDAAGITYDKRWGVARLRKALESGE